MPKKVGIVFLHGSGSNGNELNSFLSAFPIEELGFRTFRRVCDENNYDLFTPTSPVRSYTGYMGMNMNIWFDRSDSWMSKGFDEDFEDIQGIEQSRDQILKLINDIKNDYDMIILGGFSMGGCLAINMLYDKLPSKVFGIFSIGSYVIRTSRVLKKSNNLKLTLLMMHGIEDPLIQLKWGQETATSLLLNGNDVQFRQYEQVEHEIDGEELHDLFFWLQNIITTSEEEAKTAATIISESSTSSSSSGVSSSAKAATSQAAKATHDVTGHMKDMTVRDDEEDAVGEEIRKITSPDGAQLKYKLIPIQGEDDAYRIEFELVPEAITVLASRPVLCCGAVFDISAKEDRTGVMTKIISSHPDNTAKEIAKRLIRRLSDDPTMVNPCPMS